MGEDKQNLKSDNDLEQCYVEACKEAPAGVKVIAQNTQSIWSVRPYDELFYAPVNVNNVQKGMLDSGSIACTFSEEAEQKMLKELSKFSVHFRICLC